jgi:hypothetical protein
MTAGHHPDRVAWPDTGLTQMSGQPIAERRQFSVSEITPPAVASQPAQRRLHRTVRCEVTIGKIPETQERRLLWLWLRAALWGSATRLARATDGGDSLPFSDQPV